MSRVQLALNVSDLDASSSFYSKLFNTKPHKLRARDTRISRSPNRRSKLVLIEQTDADRGAGPQGALNHLGVEVETTAEVAEAARKLADDASTPSKRWALPVATPSKTRCGSSTRRVLRGRSTRDE